MRILRDRATETTRFGEPVSNLQRILRYGKLDGSLAIIPQRTLISTTDAIIAGEGEGPLANTPVPSGFVTGAVNAAAAEWVHARLMGFDPEKILLIREAFGRFNYSLTDFSPDSIRVWIADTDSGVFRLVGDSKLRMSKWHPIQRTPSILPFFRFL